MEDKSRVMISYRGTAEELEEEFEGKINYLGQSSSIDNIKFPLEEKELWIYITETHELSYIAKVDDFLEYPKDKMAKNYKNAEKFNSKWEWEGQEIKGAYRVIRLWKIHNPMNLDYLQKSNIIKKAPMKPIYTKEAVAWWKLLDYVRTNGREEVF